MTAVAANVCRVAVRLAVPEIVTAVAAAKFKSAAVDAAVAVVTLTVVYNAA
jgi:hypothetical protein